jgi:hypothetical protein
MSINPKRNLWLASTDRLLHQAHCEPRRDIERLKVSPIALLANCGSQAFPLVCQEIRIVHVILHDLREEDEKLQSHH